MAKNDKRVLITGGAGFIGTHAAREFLMRGYEVILFDIRGLSTESLFILGDLADAPEVEIGAVDNWPLLLDAVKRHRPRCIVHAATITNPVYLFKNPLLGLRTNVDGTMNVLEAMRLFDVQRLVYFSSIGVLPAVQYEPIDAAHPIILPRSGPGTGVYGATKVACEALCYAYSDAYGTDFRVLRPSAVYGFGMQWPIYIKPMVEAAVRGEKQVFESGRRFPRDYTHVIDVAALTVALAEAPADSDRIFYGATGQPLVTAGDVADIVMDTVAGAEIEIADRFTPEDEIELAYRGRISIDNAVSQLGWSPRYREIRDGIEQYVEQYRAFLARS